MAAILSLEANFLDSSSQWEAFYGSLFVGKHRLSLVRKKDFEAIF